VIVLAHAIIFRDTPKKAMEQVRLACPSSAQVQMYGCVASLICSIVSMALGIILRDCLATGVCAASIVAKQIINNSYDEDHMQDMRRIHNQLCIVFQLASSGLDGGMIAMMTRTFSA